MRYTTIALGLAIKLAAAYPTLVDTRDPMPFGDLLWECKDVRNFSYFLCASH